MPPSPPSDFPVDPAPHGPAAWDPALRELLKKYPPPTLRAARHLRAGDHSGETVRIFVLGVIARHLSPETGPRLRLGDDHLQLTADLGLDSLALLEMIVVVEEVMGRSVTQEQLRLLRTVGDMVELIANPTQLNAGNITIRPLSVLGGN